MSNTDLLNNFEKELAKKRWHKTIHAPDAEGINIDLYMIRDVSVSAGLFASPLTWRTYVMVSPQFIDQENFQEYVNVFEMFRKKITRWTEGEMFFLCILAERGVSSDVLPKVNMYSMPFLQTKGGGGYLCIVDLPEKTVHMKIPRLPLHMRAMCKEFVSIIHNALSDLDDAKKRNKT